MRKAGWIVLATWGLAGPLFGQGYDPATAGRDGLVVVANRKVEESEALARFYADQRGVPSNRVLVLDLPATEAISRADYEQRLRNPLLDHLRALNLVEQVRREERGLGPHDSGWHTVRSQLRYVVLIRGVPLRIDDTKPWPLDKVANLVNHGFQKDEAAVDSELSLMLYDTYELRGRVGNPMYNQLRWDVAAAGTPLVMVARLDGPRPELVRRQVEEALATENRGLQGRVYVDQRAPRTDDYQTGDYWLEEAAQRLAREGYEISAERTDAVFGDAYPMDAAAFYLGWYTEQVAGPFTRSNFAFRPGAVAYHNHSGNAVTLRSADQHWCGPLLDRGAAVTVGAVAEPFLAFTPQLAILVDRLCLGLTWGEAVYLSLPVLSWQTTVVGDPLYRPFALKLEDQIRQLEAAGDPQLGEAQVRLANRMVREGLLNPALRYLRECIRKKSHPALHARLAELYAMNELYDEASQHFELAVDQAASPEFAVRIAARYLTMLDALGRKEIRTRVEQKVRERWSGHPVLEALSGATR